MFTLLPLIFRNVLRNRRRSLLTLLSVAVSLCVLGVMVALYQGFFLPVQTSPSQARRVIVRHKVSLTQALPVSYQGKISSIEGIEAMSQWQWYGGIYKDSRDPNNFFAQFGVEPATFFDVRPDLKIPDDQRKAFAQKRTGAVVARGLAEQFGWKIGDRIPITSEIFANTLEFDLVGIFDHPKTDKFLAFNREYLRESMSGARDRDSVGTFTVLLKSTDDVNRFCRTVDTMFANSPEPTRTETEQQFGASFVNFLGNVKLYIAVICAAVTFTILLVTGNTVAMAVRERTRELAILRTLGFAPSEVSWLVIGESTLLGLMGGVLGVGLSAVLVTGVSKLPGFFEAVIVRWEQGAVVLATSVFVGFFSSLIPALLVSRRNVVESLRFMG